jgi:lipopolysaccharide/colanic/teichoic acid biosynthesis glycosyltransferase
MPFRKLLQRLKIDPSDRWGRSIDFLHRPDRFRDLLDRERMRADRGHTSFSLAVFTLPIDDAEALRVLIRLEQRLRLTDHAGFMDVQRVGVILWNTSEEGAWEFVAAMRDLFEPFDPQSEVYLYPTYQPPNPDRPGDDGTSTDLRQRGDTKAAEELFVRRMPGWKRVVDVVGACVGLVLLAPLLIATAIAIRWTSPGPVFFTQKRDGLGGKPFMIYKFRSMRVGADAEKAALRAQSEQDGPAFKLANDPRVTPIGRFLRKSCIDELPQLWNVLRGEMSLVGPRPLDSREMARCLGWERRRLQVTPGLTCIWQVYGKPKSVPFKDWMRMDIRYLRARTFLHDIHLVLNTVFSVALSRRNS